MKRWMIALLLLATSVGQTGCFATTSELQKERLLREELSQQFRAFKREQRTQEKAREETAKKQLAEQAKTLADIRLRHARVQEQVEALKGMVRQGQGGVVEVFATMQKLQKKFETSLGQITELQNQMKEMLQKQPEREKQYTELQKRYKELLTNQQALAEQAIPAKLFSRARDAYKAKKYKDALRLFKTFLRRFGSHPLSDNAHMYIGDIHRENNRMTAAIFSYSEVVEKFPNGGEAPVALFRLGVLHYKQGLCKQGRRFFRKLQKYRRQAPKLVKSSRPLIKNWRSLCKKRNS